MKYSLVCLPSAGGSASMYFSWRQYAPHWMKVIPIEYPGHGTRIKEKMISSPTLLAQDIAKQVLEKSEGKIILFGHSLGAALCLKTLPHIQQSNDVFVSLVVLSGRGETFSVKDRLKGKHLLPDPLFIDFIKSYGGMPEEILENEEVLNFFLPILRNDLVLNDFLLEETPTVGMTTPLLAISGDDDMAVSTTDLERWSSYSTQWLGSRYFNGGHFFLNNTDNTKQIMRMIQDFCIHDERKI